MATPAYAMTYPASGFFLITPDDDNDLPQITRGISFATAGTLHVLTADGTNDTIPNGSLAPGGIHSLRVRRVYEDSTVTGLVGYP